MSSELLETYVERFATMQREGFHGDDRAVLTAIYIVTICQQTGKPLPEAKPIEGLDPGATRAHITRHRKGDQEPTIDIATAVKVGDLLCIPYDVVPIFDSGKPMARKPTRRTPRSAPKERTIADVEVDLAHAIERNLSTVPVLKNMLATMKEQK